MSIIHTDIKAISDIHEFLENMDCDANTHTTSSEYAKEADLMDAFAEELKAFGDHSDKFEFKSKGDFSLTVGNFVFELVKYAQKRAAEYRTYSEQLAEEEAQAKQDAATYGTYKQQVKAEWHLQAGI